MINFKMISVLMLCAAVLLSGCGASNTVKGTAIGVGGGAAVGAGVGKIAGNTALGAIIGAAVGGTAGALIGKKMDKQKKELEAVLCNLLQISKKLRCWLWLPVPILLKRRQEKCPLQQLPKPLTLCVMP
jgi:hypothetical protein